MEKMLNNESGWYKIDKLNKTLSRSNSGDMIILNPKYISKIDLKIYEATIIYDNTVNKRGFMKLDFPEIQELYAYCLYNLEIMNMYTNDEIDDSSISTLLESLTN